MPKIIVQINGGFGNQLFQYAAGYACAKKLGYELLLDLNVFDLYKFRKYDLDKFNITEKIASNNFLKKLDKEKIFSKILYTERHLSYDFKQIKKSAYLKGYFQSEKWFEDYKDDIKQIFTFKDLSFVKNQNILDDIKNSNSVSVHLRFGDYVGDDMYDVCKQQYFLDSIKYIKKHVKNPKFFVFSDDIKMAKQNLGDIDAYFVTSSSNLEDFYLMQNCKHNIISNSSFSWWASYLNSNSDKFVLAPKTWIKGDKIECREIIPDGWVKIENKF